MAKTRFTGAGGGGGNVGGVYGINVETLAGNKTLTAGVDEIYQYLDPNVANRTITLATVGAIPADRFNICNITTGTKALYIYQNGTLLDYIYINVIKHFIFNGTNWVAAENGTADIDTLGIGYKANPSTRGTALGYTANASTYGTAVGYKSGATSSSSALGYTAISVLYSIAIGRNTNAQLYNVALGAYADAVAEYYSTAIGYYSKCVRNSELSINIDAQLDQENNIIIIGWTGDTTNNTPKEIFCAGRNNERCTVRASSVLAFKITVTARDNTANEIAMYTFEGCIKRDGANNTTMGVCNKTVVYEDDASWDCDVTADDTNEALIITVTGDAANTVQWVARLDGVETHF